jgi:hypothetical protein
MRAVERMLKMPLFDMLRSLGASSKAATVFLPHQPGAINDLSSQIRKGFLEAQAADVQARTSHS